MVPYLNDIEASLLLGSCLRWGFELAWLNTYKDAPCLSHDAYFRHINGLISPREKGSTRQAQREPAAQGCMHMLVYLRGLPFFRLDYLSFEWRELSGEVEYYLSWPLIRAGVNGTLSRLYGEMYFVIEREPFSECCRLSVVLLIDNPAQLYETRGPFMIFGGHFGSQFQGNESKCDSHLKIQLQWYKQKRLPGVYSQPHEKQHLLKTFRVF